MAMARCVWLASVCAAVALVACEPARPRKAPILLFAGSGTSPNDVAALEDIMRDQRLAYATADSAQLDALSADQLASYRLLIVPGGNFEVMGNQLTPATNTRLKLAIAGGLNYLGICAGAFFAGNSPFNGLDLTGGVHFPFYSAEGRGIRKAVVPLTTASGTTLDQYWEDGPALSGWGAIIAKYPDGTPAIVEGSFGKGFVLLSGVHPEAPESWRKGLLFETPVAETQRYTATLIDAALHGRALAHD
jgi:glutamine amidotransferase-like uncharacterized protein